MHAVNNFWENNTGHAFDNGSGGKVLAEGNVFQNVKATMNENKGSVFAASSSIGSQCQAILKHTCAANTFNSSPAIEGSNASVLSSFQGKDVASVASADGSAIKAKAGVGKI